MRTPALLEISHNILMRVSYYRLPSPVAYIIRYIPAKPPPLYPAQQKLLIDPQPTFPL